MRRCGTETRREKPSFYGNYDAVSSILDALPREADGAAMGEGVTIDMKTGFATGFIPFDGEMMIL